MKNNVGVLTSFQMFRPETGQEIAWEHETQIFLDLQTLISSPRSRDSADATWQLALCYHLGFGVSPSNSQASLHAKAARSLAHPVSQLFESLLQPDTQFMPDMLTTYREKIRNLVKISLKDDQSPLIEACLRGNLDTLNSAIQNEGKSIISEECGCTLFHWLFMLEDDKLRVAILTEAESMRRPIQLESPCATIHTVHQQWPLELSGTPLAFAIAVNDLLVIRHLLRLGAKPLDCVYKDGQFPKTDPRSQWTALHVAVKYHSPAALQAMLDILNESVQLAIPLGCSLSYSSPLERRAMHGPAWRERLKETVVILQSLQCLADAAPNGMTAIAQAIDYHDVEVVSALLEAEPRLSSAPLRSPEDSNIYNLPIHFAAQLAARRDVSGITRILELINSCSQALNTKKPPPYDSLLRTPLHLSVTGPSSQASKWLLDTRQGLLGIEDKFGRTALHCCRSRANCELLLDAGANINHTDTSGMTALHMACFNGNLEVVHSLLKYKPLLHLMNNNYGTPLHCAIINGSLEMVMALLQADSPVNVLDRHGNAPIHVAVRMRRYTILRFLVRYHANISLRNGQDETAEKMALCAGNRIALGILGSHFLAAESEVDVYDGHRGAVEVVSEDIPHGTVENIELATGFHGDYGNRSQGDATDFLGEKSSTPSDEAVSSEGLGLKQTRSRVLVELTNSLAAKYFDGKYSPAREIVELVVGIMRERSNDDVMLAVEKVQWKLSSLDTRLNPVVRLEVLLGVLQIMHPTWCDGLGPTELEAKIHWDQREREIEILTRLPNPPLPKS